MRLLGQAASQGGENVKASTSKLKALVLSDKKHERIPWCSALLGKPSTRWVERSGLAKWPNPTDGRLCAFLVCLSPSYALSYIGESSVTPRLRA